MPKQIVPGLLDYGDDGDASSKQTVFPKAQGNAPQSSPAAAAPEIVPGLKDYGGDKVAAPPSADEGLSWYNVFHPKPADLSRPQTWTDWMTRNYEPSVSDAAKAALDDASFGTADWAQSKLTGENVGNIRARTADAQAAMGPMGPVVNALTYAVPGAGVARGLEAVGAAGKVAGALGRYGAGALEGATASGTSSVGHQLGGDIDALKVAKDTATGAAFGVGGQAVGDIAAGTVRNVSNYVRGSPGRSGEQWDWRTRAASDPSVRTDIAAEQALRSPNDPAQPALAKAQAALSQSVEPGRMADIIYGATGVAGGYLGVPADYALLGGIGGLTAGGVTKQMFGAPGARAINTIDRNINVGQSLDQLYPALYGPQKTPALDTSGWADAIRQLSIGSERPGPPGAQFW